MIDYLFHTFWGIVHVVGTVVFFRLEKGSACDRSSHQVSPSCPIGTTESGGKCGVKVEPRFDDPPTRKLPDAAGDGKVVSLAM